MLVDEETIKENALAIAVIAAHQHQTAEILVEKLGRGMAWLDTGTHESLQQAANFIETIETRQGFKIACLEEIGFRRGYLTRDELARRGEDMKNSKYGEYLLRILRDVR